MLASSHQRLYPLSQQIQLERLAEDLHVGTKPGLAVDRVADIPGDEQNRERGHQRLGSVGELASIQSARQPNICYQQVHAGSTQRSLQYRQAVESVPGFEDGIAEFP